MRYWRPIQIPPQLNKPSEPTATKQSGPFEGFNENLGVEGRGAHQLNLKEINHELEMDENDPPMNLNYSFMELKW